jgi:tRNA dimethylallyltransferase
MPKKTIVIIGPTASGKSDLAIKFALEQNGEVISVDSRQVFRGMDIGTGKVTKEEQLLAPHHLLDIVSPGENYNVTNFCKDAKQKEQEIRARGKLPIFCGGTLFWMESYLKQSTFPSVQPNQALRTKLDQKSSEELFTLLTEKDPRRAVSVDPKNKMRLIRALEIIEELGSVPIAMPASDWRKKYELVLVLPEKDTLRENIRSRLEKRFAEGMVTEVQTLLARGVSHEWLERIGLEYKYLSLFLRGELTEDEMKEKLFFAIWHYAKRQITFLKKFE